MTLPQLSQSLDVPGGLVETSRWTGMTAMLDGRLARSAIGDPGSTASDFVGGANDGYAHHAGHVERRREQQIRRLTAVLILRSKNRR